MKIIAIIKGPISRNDFKGTQINSSLLHLYHFYIDSVVLFMEVPKEEIKKLKLALGCLFVIIALLFSATEDRFQKVINHQENSDVAEKLESFRKEGIERTLENDSYKSELAIKKAFSYLGAPAVMGGTSHKGIDCSGLVMVALKSCNIKVPHSAEDQARYGKIIPSMESLERGDLVFFYDSYTTSKFISHTGIYLGENEFIHTSSSKGVVVSMIDDPYYWKKRFLFGTRF